MIPDSLCLSRGFVLNEAEVSGDDESGDESEDGCSGDDMFADYDDDDDDDEGDDETFMGGPRVDLVLARGAPTEDAGYIYDPLKEILEKAGRVGFILILWHEPYGVGSVTWLRVRVRVRVRLRVRVRVRFLTN